MRSPRLPALWLAAVALPLLAGLAVVLARADDSASRQEGRPPASLVAIGHPITAYAAGTPKTGQIEMRAEHVGRPRAVLYYTFRKLRRGRVRTHRCTMVGDERSLRTFPVRQTGNCLVEGIAMAPLSYSIGTGTGLPVTITGMAGDAVASLHLDGPGGSAAVPLSRHRAFLILYAKGARGPATLTAQLRDGSTKFFKLEIPPSFVAPGSAEARDTAGLPAWTASANVVRFGPRKRQTCVQARQRSEPQARGLRAGGAFSPPLCGDFRREPIIADATRQGPSKRLGPFRNHGSTPRRLLVWGAVARNVTRIVVHGPDGPRTLQPAVAGRAFITVYPAGVDPAAVTITIELADGSSRTYPAPRRIGVLGLNHPRLELRGPLHLRPSATDPTKIIITAALSRVAQRFDITFRGRRISMRRAGPASPSREAYTGIYDTTSGRARSVRVGRFYYLNVVRCAEGCVRSLEGVRVGAPRR